MYWPWIELGLSGPSDLETVKHAYARRLKEVHPEEDPEGFQRLHRAYTAARRLAALMERGEPVPPPPESPPQEELPSQPPPAEPSQSKDIWDFQELLRDDGTEQEPDWQEPYFPPPPPPQTTRRLGWLLFALLGGLCCLIIVPILLARSIPNTDQRNAQQLLNLLEEDFGVELVSSPNNRDREDDIYLFWEKDNPAIRFQANLEGERDREDGERGYRTNYADAKFYGEMRNFLLAWPEYTTWYDIERTDPDGEDMAEHAAPQGYYVFQLPLEGTEDFLTALGNRLQRLSQEDWFITYPPQFQLDFLHGDALILEYLSDEDPLPDGSELVQSYEDNLGPSMLLALLNDHGVANWDYPNLDAVSILRQGDEGRVLDDPCWWVTCHGTDLSGKAQTINYFLNKNFTRIYAISQDVLDGSGADIILEEWDPIQLECGCEIAVWRSRS